MTQVNREPSDLQARFDLSKNNADEFNTRVAEHNSNATRLKARIDEYNSSVGALQAAYAAHAGACAGERHLKE